MVTNKIENYLSLLNIQRAGKRRETYIIGAVFLIFFVAMFITELLDKSSGRFMYLDFVMIAGFGFSFLTTWVRFEIIKGSIELIENLLLDD